MKIFSIKRLLGLAAIYGGVQYARKHGGAKNAFNELLGKAKDFASGVKQEVSSVASDASKSSSSGYTGSGIGSRSVGSTDTPGYGGGGSNGRGGY